MNVENLPEVFLSDTAVSYKVSRLVQRNQIRNITGKLYTSNMTDDLDKISQNMGNCGSFVSGGNYI